MAFNHEAHREHNKRIEEIDKKAGIGKYNPHNFTAKSEALKKKKIPKEYRGNTNSEGGIPFGRKPR